MVFSQIKRISCYLIAFLFVVAGMLHFIRPAMYIAIMPPYVPFPRAMVYLSGVFEVLGGLGVLRAGSRRWAGYGLALLLLAVFPANIHMALHPDQYVHLGIAPIWFWLRLPLQFVLIAWILWATRIPSNPPA